MPGASTGFRIAGPIPPSNLCENPTDPEAIRRFQDARAAYTEVDQGQGLS
jgi:hypothetical protein